MISCRRIYPIMLTISRSENKAEILIHSKNEVLRHLSQLQYCVYVLSPWEL